MAGDFDRVALIRLAVERFNTRDIDALVTLLHPMAEWPDLMDDKLIWGREAVRDYWERQLSVVSPHLTPHDFTPVGDDLVVASTQRVLDRETGVDLMPVTEIVQRFSFRDGLIAKLVMFATVDDAVATDPTE